MQSTLLALWKISLLRLIIPILLVVAPGSKAFAESRVWISNPTGFPITYKLLFANSAQNFTIPGGRRNEHTSREYPATFLVDLNVNLRGYPQVKRFRLAPGRTYYFHITGTQLHLLKQPIQQPVPQPAFPHQTHVPAPVTLKVLVYALGGPNPVYHSGVILYNTSDPYINGQEWSFFPYGNAVMGNIGYIATGRVAAGRPNGVARPLKVFDLTTRHNPQMAAAIFNDVRNRWNQMPYRPLDSNCNHFVNDVMNALGAGRHPVQYQNSWGNQVPLTQVQNALEHNYGVHCDHRGHGGAHGPAHHSPHGKGHKGPHPPPAPVSPKEEILRQILKRIGL